MSDLQSSGPSRDAVLAVSAGDPAGIGPDIALTAWRGRAAHTLPPFVLYGDPDTMRRRAARLALDVPVETVTDPRDASGVFPRALPVISVPLAGSEIPGRPDSRNGKAVIQAIELAAADVARGRAIA
ncbi:MAG: 4-hydroxythreonine-4-phosphate dehydrogenase, partial [Hyphomicrobiaceae bacterium]